MKAFVVGGAVRDELLGVPVRSISASIRSCARSAKSESAIQAAFMIGFTYAEEIRDFPAARDLAH